VVRTGEKMDTRYSIKQIVLPQQRQHTPPPKNQSILNLENLSAEQKQQIAQILKQQQSEDSNSDEAKIQ
jgi:hypothetical protein